MGIAWIHGAGFAGQAWCWREYLFRSGNPFMGGCFFRGLFENGLENHQQPKEIFNFKVNVSCKFGVRRS